MDGMLTSKEAVRLYMEDFSAKLIEIREKKGLKPGEMAKRSFMDPSNYNKYENGQNTNVSLETILKWSSALDVEPKDFFNFKFDKEKFKIKD